MATGRSYTVLATGLMATTIAPVVLGDDPAGPTAGSGKLRFLQASPFLGGDVDVYVTAPDADLATVSPTLSDLPYGTASDYLELPAGSYRVRVTVPGGKLPALDVDDFALAPGQVRTAVVVDAPDGAAPYGAIVLEDEN